MILRNTKGFILVSVLAAFAATAFAFQSAIQAFTFNYGERVRLKHKVMAEALASELLEGFRSMTGSELAQYLRTNPYDSALPPYPLCAHINLFNGTDQSLPQILNVDPGADLGSSPLDSSSGPANRFYQVTVVDMTTMQFKANACGTSYVYDPVTNPNDKFFVSVGMSWFAPSARIRETTVLSTVILQ